MKDFSMHESEDGEVTMGGMLTVENAADIRDALLGTLRRNRRLKITVGDDAVVDLSFLQIACSLHRTAVKADKTVMQGSFSVAFVSTIASAGFARSRACAAGGEDNCLWNIRREK